MSELRFGQAINRALADAMAADSSVILLGEDVGAAGGPFGVTRGLQGKFGSARVRDTPISEAAIVGAAVGAAMSGLRPVVEIMFMDFVTLAMDALVNQAAKARYHVRRPVLGADGGAHAARRRHQCRPAAFAVPGSLARACARPEGRLPGDRRRRLWARCARRSTIPIR